MHSAPPRTLDKDHFTAVDGPVRVASEQRIRKPRTALLHMLFVVIGATALVRDVGLSNASREQRGDDDLQEEQSEDGDPRGGNDARFINGSHC